jgi:hypothetical protein
MKVPKTGKTIRDWFKTNPPARYPYGILHRLISRIIWAAYKKVRTNYSQQWKDKYGVGLHIFCKCVRFDLRTPTEMSTSNRRPARKADNLTSICEQIV